MAEPLFRFEEVTVADGDRHRLDRASGGVPGRGITVIIGPSGSGKSTLLRCCNRLEVPTSGRVLFRGDDVAGLDPLALRREVGIVFQRPTPFPGTVRENLLVAEPSCTDAVAADFLERVGLGGRLLDRNALELSGGEAQRLCLARTLITRPQVVLLDEVTSSVDIVQRQGIEALAQQLARDHPILWVTHDLAQMRRLADHVLVVIAGGIAYAGDIDDIDESATPTVRSFMKGEAA